MVGKIMGDLKRWFSWVRYYLLGVVVCAGVFNSVDGWFAWLASLVFIVCLFYIIKITREYLEWYFIIKQAEKNVRSERIDKLEKDVLRMEERRRSGE